MADSFPNPLEAIYRQVQSVQSLCVEILTSIKYPADTVANPCLKRHSVPSICKTVQESKKGIPSAEPIFDCEVDLTINKKSTSKP